MRFTNLTEAVLSMLGTVHASRVRPAIMLKADSPDLQDLIAGSRLGECAGGVEDFTEAESFMSEARELQGTLGNSPDFVSDQLGAPRSFLLFLAGTQERFRCQSWATSLWESDALRSSAISPTWLPLQAGESLDWRAQQQTVVVCGAGQRGAYDPECSSRESARVPCQSLPEFLAARNVSVRKEELESEIGRLALDPSILISRILQTRDMIRTDQTVRDFVSQHSLRLPGPFSKESFSGLRQVASIMSLMHIEKNFLSRERRAPDHNEEFVCSVTQSFQLLYAKQVIDDEMKSHGCSQSVDLEGNQADLFLNESVCSAAMDSVLLGVLRPAPPIRLLGNGPDGQEHAVEYVTDDGKSGTGFLRITNQRIEFFSDMPTEDGAVHVDDFEHMDKWRPCRSCFSGLPAYSYPLLDIGTLSCSLPSYDEVVLCRRSALQRIHDRHAATPSDIEETQDVHLWIQAVKPEGVRYAAVGREGLPLKLIVKLGIVEKLAWDIYWLSRSDYGPEGGFVEQHDEEELAEYATRPIRLVRWHLSSDLMFENCPAQFGMNWLLAAAESQSRTAAEAAHQRQLQYKSQVGFLLKSYVMRWVRQLKGRNQKHAYTQIVNSFFDETAKRVSGVDSPEWATAREVSAQKLMNAITAVKNKGTVANVLPDAFIFGPLAKSGRHFGQKETRWLVIYKDKQFPVLCELQFSGHWILKRGALLGIWSATGSALSAVVDEDPDGRRHVSIQWPSDSKVKNWQASSSSVVSEPSTRYRFLPSTNAAPQAFSDALQQAAAVAADNRAFQLFQRASCHEECNAHWSGAQGDVQIADEDKGELGIQDAISFWSCVNKFFAAAGHSAW